jgi:hypothetical protein
MGFKMILERFALAITILDLRFLENTNYLLNYISKRGFEFNKLGLFCDFFFIFHLCS